MYNKPTIRIVDTNFAHGKALGCGDLNIPQTKFNYYRGNEQIGDIVLITDSCLQSALQLPEMRWLSNRSPSPALQ